MQQRMEKKPSVIGVRKSAPGMLENISIVLIVKNMFGERNQMDEPIKHAVIEKEWDDLVIKGKKHKHKLYLCNQAVIASEEKIAKCQSEITCKNCMKILGIRRFFK